MLSAGIAALPFVLRSARGRAQQTLDGLIGLGNGWITGQRIEASGGKRL